MAGKLPTGGMSKAKPSMPKASTPSAPTQSAPKAAPTSAPQTNNNQSSSAASKTIETVKDNTQQQNPNPNSNANQNQGQNGEGPKPGTKVAPGKVVNEKGEVENSATREMLDAGVNIASLFTGGAAGAAKQAGAQAAKQAGAQAAKQAGANAAKQAGANAAKQGAKNAAQSGAKSAAQSAAKTPKGAGSGNKDLLKKMPGGGGGIKGKVADMAMQKVGSKIEEGMGKAADQLEKNPALKKIAEKNKDEFKAVNKAFDAVGKAKSGDISGVKDAAKDAAKSAAKSFVKKIKMKILLYAGIGILAFILGYFIVQVVILPFEYGYVKMNDFIDMVGDGITNAWEWLIGADENEEEALKSIVGDIPGWESLSTNRKRILAAAALAVGAPYKNNGRPTSATIDGIKGGIDGGGLAEWLIWNISGSDPGYLNGQAIMNSSAFESISEANLKPGDFGVNGSDVGIYMGNSIWVHVDPLQGVIRGTYNGFTQFYRYKGIDGTTIVTPNNPEVISEQPTGKMKDIYPNGIPASREEIMKDIITVSVPITTKSGNKTNANVQLHKKVADQVKSVLQKTQNSGFVVYEVQGLRDWNRCVKDSGGKTSKMSQHCFGLAVDINVNENYCVYPNGKVDAGSYWRPGSDPYSIPKNGVLVNSFKGIGWGWGGDWSSKKDYMHFSYTGK